MLLNSIYTELHITEGGGAEINNEHEVRQIEMTSKKQATQNKAISCNDVFKTLPDEKKQIRTVLTKGIAGIGKTVSVQKFILDWAEGKANQDIMAIVPLPFRDLNLRKDTLSVLQLLSHYNPELKQIKNIEDKKVKLLFIFDGLDECRFHLDFQNNESCCDVSKPASVSVLLTNLIKGNLLPSALVWITCRPEAAKLIPAECVDRVTEVRGFTEAQKESYFRKKISDPNLASRIISHVKSTRSLHIMCHIPVFCWLSVVVLENMMSGSFPQGIPKTLTEMYTHFLFIQTSLKNKKYHGEWPESSLKLSQSDREMILKLGELAFRQLEKGNLIFYEDDLRRCGIDVRNASEYSSLCTEIFHEESVLYREQVFSFVHLSIQEHLAAVYAHVACVKEKKNVLKHKNENHSSLFDLHRSAVDKTLQCNNGNLDLFLRFLLGLSLDSNQTLLQGLLSGGTQRKINSKSTVSYIKDKLKTESSPDRVINLLHCLNELNDTHIFEEIQTSFTSGTLSQEELKPDQCSALAYILTMSEEVLEDL